ncbi:unnamed protein product [Diplocarpon coronariae]
MSSGEKPLNAAFLDTAMAKPCPGFYLLSPNAVVRSRTGGGVARPSAGWRGPLAASLRSGRGKQTQGRKPRADVGRGARCSSASGTGVRGERIDACHLAV